LPQLLAARAGIAALMAMWAVVLLVAAQAAAHQLPQVEAAERDHSGPVVGG